MRPFEEILAIDSAAAFDCAALELFRFQAERCGVYREYLAEIGVDPAAVRRVDEIPMLPIESSSGATSTAATRNRRSSSRRATRDRASHRIT